MSEQTVTVGLDARAYDIVIGANLLEDAGAQLKKIFRRPQTVIVADENVYAAQGARLEAGLKKADIIRWTLKNS